MSQNKRKSKLSMLVCLTYLFPLSILAEYTKPSQSGISKSQFEKRTSVSDNRKTSEERHAPADRKDSSTEKIRQFLEDHSLNNQSDISREHKETDSIAADQLAKNRFLTEPVEPQKYENKAGSNILQTPEKRASHRSDDQFISPEKELSSEPRPSEINVLPSNREKLENLSPRDRSETDNQIVYTDKKPVSEVEEEEEVPEQRVPQKSDAGSLGRVLKQQPQNIDYQKEHNRPEEKTPLNQKARPNDALGEAASQLRKAADRLTIKSFLGLRSLTNPPDCIVKSLHALLALFAGVSSFVSANILYQEVAWANLKTYLQSPIYLVGQVQTFIESCQEKRISIGNVRIASNLVCSIEPNTTQDTEAFTSIITYVLAAIEYYKIGFGIENLQAYPADSADYTVPVQKRATPIKKATPSSAKKFATPNKSQTGRVSPMLSKKINETSEKIKATLGPTTPTKNLIKYVETKAVEDPSILDRIRNASNRSPRRSDNTASSRLTVGSATTPKKRVGTPNMAKNILKLPSRNLDKKLDQALEEKNSRVNYAMSARSLSPKHDQELIADITERAKVQAETENYKKVAREFNAMKAKLLLDEERRIKREKQIQEEAEIEFDREWQKIDKKKLEEVLEKRNNEDRDYDFDMYEGRQEARRLMKVIQKETQEDYIYHELEQNLLQHYHKAEIDLDKKLDNQKDLQQNLEKVQVERAYKNHEKQVEKEQQIKEIEERNRKGLYWKKIDALNERLDAEREFRLLEKLLSNRPY